MRESTDFAAGTNFALLLIGAPLSGKTNLAMQFPDPYFFDADDKLANAVSRHKGKRFWYDNGLRDDKDVAVLGPKRWARATECIKTACLDPKVGTIVLDSATSLSDFLMDHILQFPSTAKVPLTVGGEKVMDQSMWGPFRDLWRRLIMMCRSSGKLVILIMHEKFEKDEASGSMIYTPCISGQLQSNIAGYFTDVWRAENKPGQLNGKPIVSYYVRTQPSARMALGNSLGLPAEFTFTFEDFKKQLDIARAV